MAEALFNHLYSGGDSVLRAESAGLYAEGQPISSNAELALASVGIRNFFHTSRCVDPLLMKNADRVIGLTSGIASTLIMEFPEYAGKITAFSHNVKDPFGTPLPGYIECLEDIRSCLYEMFGEPKGCKNECD